MESTGKSAGYFLFIWGMGILVCLAFTKQFPPAWFMYLPWLAFALVLLFFWAGIKVMDWRHRFTATGNDSTARRFNSVTGTRRK